MKRDNQWKHLIKYVFLTCFACAVSIGILTAQTIGGYVYEDQNGNGKKDRREQGIAHVNVSNGVDVVLTDANGYYELDVADDNIIFVVKPAGFQFPLDAYNLPQFYHVHKPKGSPTELRYAAFPPTPVVENVDFALHATTESEQFSAFIFGDPQAYVARELEFFDRGIVSEVVGQTEGITFGISLGDLVGDDLSLHSPYKEIVAKIGLPWYNVIGNHDMNFDVTADSLSDETFELNFGPANYAFNYGNAHFIVLDDILYPDPRDGQGYWGGFREDQLDFVENNLKHIDKDKLIVLAFHIPLQHTNGNSFRPEDRQRLFDILKDFPHTLSLSAHRHTQSQIFYGAEDGWRQEKPHHEYNVGTTSGDWYSGEVDHRGVPSATMRDGTPQGYAFLHVDGNQYKLDYKVAGQSADYQIRAFHPYVVPQGRSSRAGLFANFFMGHRNSKVEYRINDGDWQPMRLHPGVDPYYVSKLYPWDNVDYLLPGRRPTDAIPSSHLWRVALPTNMDIGIHEIEIRATDDYGRAFIQKSRYRIEAPKVIH